MRTDFKIDTQKIITFERYLGLNSPGKKCKFFIFNFESFYSVDRTLYQF